MPVASQQALEAVVLERYHSRMRERLRPLVTPAVVAEHQRNPFGHPGDDLRRLLTYFGNLPAVGKLITEHDGAERWYVCRRAGAPPAHAERVAGPFDDQAEAVHVIFRRRVADVFGLDLDA